MPRIHSWREIIAPRDCRRIVHRAILRPAAESSTSVSGRARYLQPRTPVESRSVPTTPCTTPSQPPPLERNEQRAISLLLNACHKSPRAPSRSPSRPLSPPSQLLHLFRPPPPRRDALSLSLSLFLFTLFHLFSPGRLHPRSRESPRLRSRFLASAQFLSTVFHRFYSRRLLRALFSLSLSHHASSSATLASKEEEEEDAECSFCAFYSLKKNDDQEVSSMFRRSSAPFSHLLARFMILDHVVTEFLTLLRATLIRPERWRKRAERYNNRHDGNGRREAERAAARARAPFRVHPAPSAASLSREIVVRRFIYARSLRNSPVASPAPR